MRRQRGFTLIELLIVVAIIGIIAAIAIPNLLNAINRGRQKRTMADMRTIASAIIAYTVDNNFFPAVGNDPGLLQMQTHITPTYLRRIPPQDGWRNPWGGVIDTQRRNYTIGSGGRDGSTVPVDLTLPGGVTTNFDEDILHSAGIFVRYPEGTQQE